ncbi:MAG: fliF [Thermoleophilia bacterium]|nr:fliF [Thermoleophilia bacterium]
MQTQLTRLQGAWAGIPRRAQLAIMGVAAVTLLIMILVIRAATSTTWVPVASDLTADKFGAAESALDEAGIGHQMNDAGTAIQVAKADEPKAAAALIPAGIAVKGGRAGCAAQSEKGGGMMAKTSAETALMLETCAENDAANTIENIEGVSKATVDITTSEEHLFTTDEQPAKASVMVDTDGSGLSKATYQGIQATVAGSVPGLKPSGVTVTDETGAIKVGPGSDDAAGGGMTKLDAEAKLNAKIEHDLMGKLEGLVGNGNVVLTSNVWLDMDRIKREVTENTPAGTDGTQIVDSEKTHEEILDGPQGASAVQGVTGTGSNIGVDQDNRTVTADPTATTGTAADSKYATKDAATNYANNKVAEAIDVAPGAIQNYKIGMVVDDDVDPAAALAAKNLVTAWMGGNSADSFSFDQAPIASAQPVKKAAASNASAIAGYVKWVLLGLGLIGLAFVLRRTLTQRTAELLSPADDLLLLESGDFTPIPIAELEAALAAGQPDAERNARLDMQRKVERIADTKPHDVANELRRWMGQDDPGYATNPLQRKAG